jgi:phosphate transport system permease protein
VSGGIPDPTAPLTPTGNLRRRQVFSKFIEYTAIAAAVAAVVVLGIVVYTVVARGIGGISLDFIFTGAPTGVAPALVGTIEIVAIAVVIAAPLGVLIALFLTEYSSNRFAGPIRLTLDLMNGLPSIIVGLFIFGLLVKPTEQSSGIAASIALAIIMLPLVARGSIEVLLLVPNAMREASDALGVARWRAVLTVILPAALGGILTSTVLAVARAAGETAPLLLIIPVAEYAKVSLNPFESLPSIPVKIYSLSEEGSPEGFTEAWGLALLLVSFILFASLGARALLARSKRKMTSS